MLTKALNRRSSWQSPTKQNLPVSGDMFITCEFQLEPIQNRSGTFVGSFAEVNRCENDFTSTPLCSLELLFFTDRSLGESGGVFFFVHERRGVLMSQFFSPSGYQLFYLGYISGLKSECFGFKIQEGSCLWNYRYHNLIWWLIDKFGVDKFGVCKNIGRK